MCAKEEPTAVYADIWFCRCSRRHIVLKKWSGAFVVEDLKKKKKILSFNAGSNPGGEC